MFEKAASILIPYILVLPEKLVVAQFVGPILNQINPVHFLSPYVNIRFNIVFLSAPRLYKWFISARLFYSTQNDNLMYKFILLFPNSHNKNKILASQFIKLLLEKEKCPQRL